jgi:SOS-response transcriptional repressor LexA
MNGVTESRAGRRLSERERVVLLFIQHFVQEHNYAPSRRDIQEACHLSKRSVNDALTLLQAWGYIEIPAGTHRAIRVIPESERRAG